ncbi:hypothetical protein E2C01_053547 [Portunus trituberculatus]|uniref:Uncharacterized protein n=1 Tax=Portunus trituberculatus TaxID=210409 RepID=A0A5B7GSD9_PORTR|nr:hypothetical protein [Portunus trituberculatus]
MYEYENWLGTAAAAAAAGQGGAGRDGTPVDFVFPAAELGTLWSGRRARVSGAEGRTDGRANHDYFLYDWSRVLHNARGLAGAPRHNAP